MLLYRSTRVMPVVIKTWSIYVTVQFRKIIIMVRKQGF